MKIGNRIKITDDPICQCDAEAGEGIVIDNTKFAMTTSFSQTDNAHIAYFLDDEIRYSWPWLGCSRCIKEIK